MENSSRLTLLYLVLQTKTKHENLVHLKMNKLVKWREHKKQWWKLMALLMSLIQGPPLYAQKQVQVLAHLPCDKNTSQANIIWGLLVDQGQGFWTRYGKIQNNHSFKPESLSFFLLSYFFAAVNNEWVCFDMFNNGWWFGICNKCICSW